jgi:hypothetical protein
MRVLLVDRLIHRLRWWVKSHTWEHDLRTQFGLDQYLGDVRGDGSWGDFSDPELRDPYFTELREPDITAMETRIRHEIPNSEALLTRIQSTWLCAPKAFRYIERVLIEIGSVGTANEPDFARTLLDCQDTYPDFSQAGEWERDLLDRLSAWLAGDGGAIPELGTCTPVKHWIVGLLSYRLQLMANWTRFVGGNPSGQSGKGAPVD